MLWKRKQKPTTNAVITDNLKRYIENVSKELVNHHHLPIDEQQLALDNMLRASRLIHCWEEN